MDTIKAFFSKIRTLCLISKRAGEISPLPSSWAPVSVAEYASISMNMPKYPRKCLNKPSWLCRGSEYAWSSYMFDKFLKMSWVLNKPAFWIWYNCICKSYTESRICLIMVACASIMHEYASACLSVPLYAWTWLNIAKCPWIYLNMPE